MAGEAGARLAQPDSRKHLKLIPPAEALNRMESALGGTRWPVEKVRVDRALMRVSAREVRSSRSIPPRSTAAMDGFAVRSADLKDAQIGRPVTLKVRGSLGPSDLDSRGSHTISAGEAFQVATGAPIPLGSDLVVKVEDTRADEGPTVKVFREFPRWKNVSFAGEDVRGGSVILRKSQVVTAAALALCLGCGKTSIDVRMRPTVGVLSVGTELVAFPPPAGLRRPKGPFNNYSNMVRGYLESRGIETVSLGVCKDKREEIRFAIEKHLEDVDSIWTIAGSSVGAADLVSEAVESIPGSELIFHGLRIVPIRPTGLAVVRGRGIAKPVIMLPGHAVSAALATFTVALPAINLLSGQGTDFGKVSVGAVAGDGFENTRPLDALLLARLARGDGGTYVATPLGWGSNLLRNLSEANGFVHLRAHESIKASSRMEVELFGPAELVRIQAGGADRA